MTNERSGWRGAEAAVLPATGAASGRGAGKPARPRVRRRILEALLDGVGDHPQARSVVARALAQASLGGSQAPLTLADFQRLVGEVASLLAPDDPAGLGCRLAGSALSEGWARHPGGRIFVDGLRTLPLARGVVRLAEGLRFGAEGLELEAQMLGTCRVRLTLRGSRTPHTAFFCGCMTRMLEILGAARVVAQTEPVPEGEVAQRLLISWDPPG